MTAAVIDAASYNSVTRDPSGTIIAPALWEELARALERSVRELRSHLLWRMWTVTPESKPRRR